MAALVGSRREKVKEYSTETNASTRQRKTTYHGEKKSRHIPWIFFPGSDIFICWVAYCLIPPLEYVPKIRTRKISTPYIFLAGVQLFVFTLSHLVVNSPKGYKPSPHFCLKHPLLPAPHVCTRFWTPRIFSSYFNYHESLGPTIRRLYALFIFYSFF